MAAPNDSRLIPIVYGDAGDMPAVHANHFVIQHTDHEFIVTFFEILPPLISTDPERQAQEIARIQEILARPVARIVMAPGRVREFIAAFQDNLNKYEAQTASPNE